LSRTVSYLALAVAQFPSYSDFNRAAYNVSFASAAVGSDIFDPILNTSEWITNAFQFCNLSVLGVVDNPVCSIIVFNSFDYISNQVSDYHFNLENGSCTNSFSIDEVYW